MLQRRFIYIMIICILSAFVSPAEAREKKNVLYLNSYHHGYQWSDQLLEGIRSVLDASPYKVDLQIEYMDAKKYPVEYITPRLFTLYSEKFKNEQFDVIIVSDNDALNFILSYRDRLFPGVPVVFCGVNDIRSVDLSKGNITGVVERFELLETVETARNLHPDKDRMIVVGDQSTAGKAIQRQVDAMMADYPGEFQVDFWFGLSLGETLNRARRLPDNVFFFFTPWYQTIRDKFYTTEEVMRALYNNSSIPIYTTWEFLLGHGAVGGYMLSGVKHGSEAARMALKILEGISIASLPVVTEKSGQYMFDYQVMQRLGIRSEKLPASAVVINSPKSFYELSKELFWTIMISILLLVTALIFLGVNMIARRRVEQKVIEQLTFQETLMDTIPQLVSWKDKTGKYLGANRAFLEFFRIHDLHAMVGKNTRDVVQDPDYVHWSSSADTAVIRHREAIRKVRRKIETFDEEPGWIEVNKVPLLDRSGKIVGILSTAENITREQNLEKQLLQSQKMEAIGTLAGGIAHDFNNILTSIINSTELAIDDVDEGSRTAEDLNRVLKAARRGGRVVKQILSFSRPSLEKFRRVDVGKIIREVLLLMDVSLPSSITVSTDLSEAEYCINADPTQIHQVILNLCTNAFHALRNTGGRLQVKVEKNLLDHKRAEELGIVPGPYIVVRVIDDGPGIRAEDIDNIFDPFFTTKDISEGTGLGLSVVHGIVSGHKGSIKVESTPGRGAEFILYLPECEHAPQNRVSADGNGTHAVASILFVEDDEDQLNSTPRILKKMGYAVVALKEPLAAVRMVREHPDSFDLVISDYDMPVMNGSELAEKLFPLPVILVSGREEAVFAAGADKNIVNVLSKPYDHTDLERAIRSIDKGKK